MSLRGSMQVFAEAWDLTLDRSKTVFWASQAADRKWLRAQGASGTKTYGVPKNRGPKSVANILGSL